MTDANAQLASLRDLSALAEIVTEGGRTAVFLPNVQFDAGGRRVTRNLLLWPSDREGYQTRMFLSDKVEGSVQRAWTSYSICGDTWWAVSWQGVPATLPWIEMLANHLGAFK